jgi:exodeoxyribonuclease VII large subunit
VPISQPDTLSPSQLNRQVRSLLESHYDFVWVEGEVSNFARPSSGHWYFTLKDDRAQVRCALFRNRNQRLRFTPANGDQVRLRARVSLYEGRGEFQLIGEFLEAAGAGALQARFEALRDRLRDEGLFDSARKRPLPTHVAHLAVISSPTGAALQDVLQVLARRNPAIAVTVIGAAVQGDRAPAELCRALALANECRLTREDCDFDAIILARGGGSLEDLWAFNDETLARAITQSALPVVVGVGHEVDVTIADFAADYRAPTPSAAAEVLSANRDELLVSLDRQQRALALALHQRLERERLKLAALASRLKHPGDRLREQAQRVDDLERAMLRAVQQRLSQSRDRRERAAGRLAALSPLPRLRRERARWQEARHDITLAIQRRLAGERTRLGSRAQLLESLSPLAVLNRGYAIIRREDGTVLRESTQTRAGESLRARLASGALALTVDAVIDAPDGDDVARKARPAKGKKTGEGKP